jgi:hypothetical protein
MSIDCCDTFICSRLEQFTGDDLLNCQHNTIFAPNSNGSSAVFYCFDSILDLEIPSIGGEDGIRKIVTRSY